MMPKRFNDAIVVASKYKRLFSILKRRKRVKFVSSGLRDSARSPLPFFRGQTCGEQREKQSYHLKQQLAKMIVAWQEAKEQKGEVEEVFACAREIGSEN